MLRSTVHEESDVAGAAEQQPWWPWGGCGSVSFHLRAWWRCWAICVPSVHVCCVLCPFSTWVFVSMFLGFEVFQYIPDIAFWSISLLRYEARTSPLLWALPLLCSAALAPLDRPRP